MFIKKTCSFFAIILFVWVPTVSLMPASNFDFDFYDNGSDYCYMYDGNVNLNGRTSFSILNQVSGDRKILFLIKGDLILEGDSIIDFPFDGFKSSSDIHRVKNLEITSNIDSISIVVEGDVIGNGKYIHFDRNDKDREHIDRRNGDYEDQYGKYYSASKAAESNKKYYEDFVPVYGSTVLIALGRIQNVSSIKTSYEDLNFELYRNKYSGGSISRSSKDGMGQLYVTALQESSISNFTKIGESGEMYVLLPSGSDIGDGDRIIYDREAGPWQPQHTLEYIGFLDGFELEFTSGNIVEGTDGNYYMASGLGSEDSKVVVDGNHPLSIDMQNAKAEKFYNLLSAAQPRLESIVMSVIKFAGPDSRKNYGVKLGLGNRSTFSDIVKYFFTPLYDIAYRGKKIEDLFETSLYINHLEWPNPEWGINHKVWLKYVAVNDAVSFDNSVEIKVEDGVFFLPPIILDFNGINLENREYQIKLGLTKMYSNISYANIFEANAISPNVICNDAESKFITSDANEYPASGFETIYTSENSIKFLHNIKVTDASSDIFTEQMLKQNISAKNLVSDTTVSSLDVLNYDVDGNGDIFYTISSNFIGLKSGVVNELVINTGGVLGKSQQIIEKVRVVSGVDQVIDVESSDTFEIALTQDAMDNEDKLWKCTISDTNVRGESLEVDSFDYTSDLVNVSFKPESGVFTDDVNFIKVTATLRDTDKEKVYYYAVCNSGSDDKVRVFDSKGEITEDFSSYYKLNGNNLSEIITKYRHSDFFAKDDVAVSGVFPDIFGKVIELKSTAVKFNKNNYLTLPNSSLVANNVNINNFISNLDFSDIQNIFAEKFDEVGINSACVTLSESYVKNGESEVFTPSFPTRTIVSFPAREDNGINLYVKPALKVTSTDAYQIIAVNKTSLSDSEIETILTNFDTDINIVDPPTSFPDGDNGLWSKVNGVYRSKWISNGLTGIRIGSSEGVDFNIGDKVHFFTKIAYKVNSGVRVLSKTTRHTAIKLTEEDLTVTLDQDFLDDPDLWKMDGDGDDNQLTIHTKVRLASDVRIPYGKTIKFGEHSTFSNDRPIGSVSVDDNLHFIVEGKLIIDNESMDNRVYFGASGIDSFESGKTNGLWGGIYILPRGELETNGAIISNAIDGIVLQGVESGNVSIKDTDIQYCEIGLHLYNSYPVMENVNFIGNLLYGVKEDNMVDNPGWEINAELKGIGFINNGINYYDYYNGVEEVAGGTNE